jgi:sulfite reductase (NADPH) flavoprotein alpha-component
MLAANQLKQLQEFVSGFSTEELVWINGYLCGLLDRKDQSPHLPPSPAASTTTTQKITIAFGTETGNAKKLANQFAMAAKKKGLVVKLIGLDQYKTSDLAKESYFFTVVSTHGEGEPPAAAASFYNFIHNTQPLSLPNLKFSVLALGDTAYPLFCKTGEDIGLQLQKLGAKPLVSLYKCDVDYEATANTWFNQVLTALANETAAMPAHNALQVTPKTAKKKNYEGTVGTHINLNGRGSAKETYHIEVTANEIPVFEPGDAMGIFPPNLSTAVENIIELSGADANKILTVRNHTASIKTLLGQHLNINYLPLAIVQEYAKIVGVEIPAVRMDLLDLLRIYPLQKSTQLEKVIQALYPIAPRLYSIASSPEAHNGEIHITVAKNEFQVNEEVRVGLCSQFLSNLKTTDPLPFYIHKNNAFKLPAPEKDMIMIGPGTGIAPFRSFVAERDATGATGKNWLFFGDRNFTTDFLYQTEWQQYIATGVLTKINLAWSRDSASKYYVQDELKKEAAELMAWIEAGAYLYLCGAKTPMAADVEKQLLAIIAQSKKIDDATARIFLDQLIEEGRYCKDVY